MISKKIYVCSKFNINLEKKPLFFFHVPKCAGTTVSTILSWLIEPQSRIPGSLFKNNDKKGRPAFDLLEGLQDPSAYNQLNFVYGHLPYEVLSLLNKTFLKVTVLRDPVKRAYSHYNWMLNRKYCSEQDNLNDIFDQNMITTNTITNQFSGFGILKKDTDKSLESAYHNLTKNIDRVYDSENIFDLLEYLISIYNLPNLIFQNQQESEYKNDEKNSSNISIIKERNKLDIELYKELKKNKVFKNKDDKKETSLSNDYFFSSPHLKFKNKNNTKINKKEFLILLSYLKKNKFKIIEYK